MRTIPNDIVQTLLRTLPLILDNMDEKAVQTKLRLNNAVRLTKKIVKRLEKIECDANSETG
nr:MAG TPA: hypothetical protein [Bacteriophage sp.]